MLYHRISSNVFFLTPSLAVGIDVDGSVFLEFAWFNIAIGIGEAP
jgi:hypothetical protein